MEPSTIAQNLRFIISNGGGCIPLDPELLQLLNFQVWHAHTTPPLTGLHKVPGSLPVVPIRSDEDTKITIELKNVVVPTASGCYFGS
ncbi:MAG: hypothetical protein P1P76_04850 [Anaerolineales bacterium]|nr:hypothetical protein [Anaerolineales bacterium]